MKNKLILLLKTLFASKGFNAKELEGMADLAIKQHNLTDDSTDEDLSAAGETLKPYAEFTQSVASRQVTDAKKPKPVETPKPADTPDPEDKPNPDDPNAAVLAMLKEMRGELAAIKGEKVTNTRKDQVAKLLEASDDKFKAATLKAFGRMKFETDDEFTEYLTELETDAKDFVKSDSTEEGVGAVFRPTGGAGGNAGKTKGQASDAEVTAVVDAIL
jgi:hypothetical protein